MTATVATVTSKDGTPIAYDCGGSGPPLLLVHGTLSTRESWAPVRAAFESNFTVYAMDRRGRGESGAPARHAIEAEYDDVAVLLRAIGEPSYVVGHSFGAHCALGAAATAREMFRKLVLYEPPLTDPDMDAWLARVDAQMAAGDHDGAVASFLIERIGLPPAAVDAMRAAPQWASFVALAPSAQHEFRALSEYKWDPGKFADVAVPTLLVTGATSRENLTSANRDLALAMPNAEARVLEGQGHVATATAPQLFVETVVGFFTRR